MINQATAFKPLAPVRLVDVRSEYVNVAGEQLTENLDSPELFVHPAHRVALRGFDRVGTGISAMSTRSLPVWLMPPSRLIFDVVNKGVLGDMHWQEAQRFQWDLSNTEPPDLVVFYDGVNEIWGALFVRNQRLGDSGQPSSR